MASLWSVTLGSAVRGLSWAREAGSLLVWDENQNLSLINSLGNPQGHVHLAGIAAACISDDGAGIAAVSASGQVWWLARDLTVRWERQVAAAALGAALDPFGRYLAVSDKKSGLTLFDRTGALLTQFQSPRPIHHLAFVPLGTQLAAAADFGWAG